MACPDRLTTRQRIRGIATGAEYCRARQRAASLFFGRRCFQLLVFPRTDAETDHCAFKLALIQLTCEESDVATAELHSLSCGYRCCTANRTRSIRNLPHSNQQDAPRAAH